jgi:hypothetical protein
MAEGEARLKLMIDADEKRGLIWGGIMLIVSPESGVLDISLIFMNGNLTIVASLVLGASGSYSKVLHLDLFVPSITSSRSRYSTVPLFVISPLPHNRSSTAKLTI